MSEEEKNAIAEVKDVIEYDKEHRIVTIYDKQPLFRDTLQTILNLVEKQQKEIEELKEKNEKIESINYRVNKNLLETAEELEQLKDIQQQICNEELITQECVKENYISKDKIKAKVIDIKNKPVKDEFITASQGKLNTIIEIESLLEKE